MFKYLGVHASGTMEISLRLSIFVLYIMKTRAEFQSWNSPSIIAIITAYSNLDSVRLEHSTIDTCSNWITNTNETKSLWRGCDAFRSPFSSCSTSSSPPSHFLHHQAKPSSRYQLQRTPPVNWIYRPRTFSLKTKLPNAREGQQAGDLEWVVVEPFLQKRRRLSWLCVAPFWVSLYC